MSERTRNRRVLWAWMEGSEKKDRAERVLVDVGDNSHFIPGMVLAGCHEVRPGVWKYPGRRPRFLGRW